MKKLTPVSRLAALAAAQEPWPAVDLSADCLELLGSALKKQWKRYRKELKRCQEKFSEKAVHDSRVETRRLLALIELLGTFLPASRVKMIQAALKAHLDTYDDLRDTQVQMRRVSSLRRAYAAARPFYDYLCKREARFARRTRKRIKHLKAGRLAKLIGASRLELGQRHKQPLPAKAAARLSSSLGRAFRTTCRLRDRIDPADTRSIHETRVAFKKFRYMVEALSGYLPAGCQPKLEAMHHYQTLMGDIQDAEVLLQCFEKYLGKNKRKPKAAGQFQQELLDRRTTLIRTYLNAADQLVDFWPPTRRLTGAEPLNRPPKATP
jgi:CHAD domain-containing protein